MQDGASEHARTGRIGRRRALMKNGWYAVLTPAEHKLWDLYDEHADRNGDCYPSLRRLADAMGHRNTNHIGALRDRLVTYGLLEVIEEGGGRGHVCRVRLATPGPAPKTGGKHSQHGSVSECASGQKHSGRGSINTPAVGLETLPIWESLNKEEQPSEQPSEQVAPSASRRPVKKVKTESVNGRSKKPPVFPPGVWDRARDGWSRAWTHIHRCEFRWSSRQTKGLRDVLVDLKSDLAQFERVAKAYLREPEIARTKGHPLWQLAEDLNYIESKIAKGSIGHGPEKPSATQRGEFPEPQRRLKVLNADPADALAG